MAAGPKQFCAVALPIGVLTDLYTAPLEAVVSTLVVCNRGTTATSFRLSHAPGGAADAMAQYFAYDLPIAASTMVPFTMGICLMPGDVLRGYAANANLSVTAWGEEQGVNGDMGASFFLELADTPASYIGEAGKAVLVNPTEDGLIFDTVDTEAGAPVDAEFIVAATNAVLTGERVLTDTATVTWDFTTAGQARATAAGAPSGLANTVSFFNAAGALTSETLFAYDSATHYLRVGPLVPLSRTGLCVSAEAETGLSVTPHLSVAEQAVTGVYVEQPVLVAPGSLVSFDGIYVYVDGGTATPISGVRGVTSYVSAGANRWNFYADSYAPNLFTGGVEVGNATSTNDGTMRYTGTDFQGRKAGAWVSLTAVGGGTPTGLANTVAFFNAAGTLASEAALVYNDVTHSLYLGTEPTYPAGLSVEVENSPTAMSLAVRTSEPDTSAIGLYVGSARTEGLGVVYGYDMIYVYPDTTVATVIRGVRSAVPDGPGRWNFYADTFAPNYLQGGVTVGNATSTVDGTIRYTGDFQGRKAGAWVSLTAGVEEAQDAVGTILIDSATIDFTYNDTTPSITAAVVAGSIGTTELGNSQVTYAKIQNVTDARLLGRSSGSAGSPIEIAVGTGLSLAAGVLTSTVTVDPFRLGHTWALVGDATLYTTLPSIFVPMLGTQAAVLYGIRTKLGSGTSIGVQVRRNGGNVGSVITVTTTAATTTLGNVALADNDELAIVLSAPVGTPSHLTATVILEHTP